jgi:hypothetical protein
MLGRMTRSAPQSPFELPEVTAVVRATHLSCRTPEKRKNLRRFGVHLENLSLIVRLAAVVLRMIHCRGLPAVRPIGRNQ